MSIYVFNYLNSLNLCTKIQKVWLNNKNISGKMLLFKLFSVISQSET